VWTCGSIHDRTADGRTLEWLTPGDEYTRECLGPRAAASLGGAAGRRIVARAPGRRGASSRIGRDHGPESSRAAPVDRRPGQGATPIPVAAGHPREDGHIESFQGRSRDEFWERTAFDRVADAQAKGTWDRGEDDPARPPGSAGHATRKEFSAARDRDGGGSGVAP